MPTTKWSEILSKMSPADQAEIKAGAKALQEAEKARRAASLLQQADAVAFYAEESARFDDGALVCAACARAVGDQAQDWMGAVLASEAAEIAGDRCADCKQTFPVRKTRR